MFLRIKPLPRRGLELLATNVRPAFPKRSALAHCACQLPITHPGVGGTLVYPAPFSKMEATPSLDRTFRAGARFLTGSPRTSPGIRRPSRSQGRRGRRPLRSAKVRSRQAERMPAGCLLGDQVAQEACGPTRRPANMAGTAALRQADRLELSRDQRV